MIAVGGVPKLRQTLIVYGRGMPKPYDLLENGAKTLIQITKTDIHFSSRSLVLND